MDSFECYSSGVGLEIAIAIGIVHETVDGTVFERSRSRLEACSDYSAVDSEY